MVPVLRVERGVSGEELPGLGYKVSYLPKKTRVAKAAHKPTQRQKRIAKRRKRYESKEQRSAQKARWRARQIAAMGVEAYREKHNAYRRQQRAAQRAREAAGA